MIDPEDDLPDWLVHKTSENLIIIETNDRNDNGIYIFKLVATA